MTASPAADAAGEGDELRRRRARSQLLHRPAGLAPTAIVGHLLAVQAQDERSARLAIRARTNGLHAADVSRDLLREPELVIGWLGRGTLHMVCTDDYAWLLGLTAPGRLAASRRRLAQSGLGPAAVERAVRIIEQGLAADGPLTRTRLAERVERAGIPAAGQAIVHMIMLAAMRGIAIPSAGGPDNRAVALTDDWLGGRPTADLRGEARDAALGELARRYLNAHGPARDRDLAKWAGLGLGDVRRGLARIGGALTDLPDGLVDVRSRKPIDAPLPTVLLPPFDPYMLGWEDRGFAVPADHARRVHPGGGMLRATASRDGLAIGLWTARRRAGAITVAVDPFAGLDAAVETELAAERADLARFEAPSPI